MVDNVLGKKTKFYFIIYVVDDVGGNKFILNLRKENQMLNQNFEDRDLQCVECGQNFAFSGEDQEFYHQKNYSEPKRCPACRANRKMNSGRGGGGGSRGGGGGGGRGPRPQFQAICAACGIETTVPFEPKSDRPVYCSDCYRNNG